jgi:hypothetical protein
MKEGRGSGAKERVDCETWLRVIFLESIIVEINWWDLRVGV